MWSGLNEVDEVEAGGNRSHFYRMPEEFSSSVPLDCDSDLKVQNLIADQVEGKVIVCFCHRELIVQQNANG